MEAIKIQFERAGVELVYGKGKQFYACKQGTDLNDLDELLLHFVPDVDFERIDMKQALQLEKRLYDAISLCGANKRCVQQALMSFIEYVALKYSLGVNTNRKV